MTKAHPEDADEAKAATPPPLPPRKKRDRDTDSEKEDETSTKETAVPKKARAGDDASEGNADAPKSPSFASFVAHKDEEKADAATKDAEAQENTVKAQEAAKEAPTTTSDDAPATIPAPVAATANEVAPERSEAPAADTDPSEKPARTSVPVVAPTPAPTTSGPAPVVVPTPALAATPTPVPVAAPASARGVTSTPAPVPGPTPAPAAMPATAAGAAPTEPSQTTEPVSVAETAAPPKSGPALGFGAFAARSAPFQSATALSDKAKAGKDDATNWTKAESTESAPTPPDAEDIVVRKRAIQKPDTELTTGEEEEETVASTRAKLYSMAKDHSWKERGMGVLKLNRKVGGDASSARLVMRSDAVLRVILNVKLFAGMQCHVEQERFLRIVAMEQEGLVHFALKLANAHEAEAFLAELQQNIPAQPRVADK
ncbi:hypothetical protein MBRA1_003525 [Malassezia brasiliensis]|uniref:RanBD1 domain-containing protein n=1 Tax=Malassezia brasiliensis TaxID=1821822 RepID=A0AAF0DWV4_9BASI|nr:hypothetical protein MBRA1_003525 [Malassezia brasiliensis]